MKSSSKLRIDLLNPFQGCVLRTQPWKALNKTILNFEEDFTWALTALVTAQDDSQRLKELTQGAKSILNDYKDELPNILRKVKLIFFFGLTIID